MLIVDTALKKRAEEGNPIRLGIVGAGYSGRTIAYQILTAFPAIRLVAMSNRTLSTAREALVRADIPDVKTVETLEQLDQTITSSGHAITEDFSLLCKSDHIDVIIEATGTIEFGSQVVTEALKYGKNVVLMNVELDATVGPILKVQADRAGVVITNTDGDEPGVAMNLIRFVQSIGLKPVVAGNLKGLYDPYRNPDTQKGFAEAHNQKATTMTSFADGTKLSMELTVLANATGFGVGQRGMYGPKLDHVNDSADFYGDKLVDGGMVDFLEGAKPGNGAFVIGHGEDPVRSDYLKYLKMGDGPLYVFYTPFHLPQLEIPLTVARNVLFRDATVTPKGGPSVDTIAVAKKDLSAGDTLDGIGGFACYGLLENYDVSRNIKALPMGVSDGCKLIRAVPKDQPVTYDDVELPEGRLCDRLRVEQEELFSS